MNTTTNETSCEAVPKCPEDLACALPLCKEGEVIEIPPGGCCPVCVRDGKCIRIHDVLMSLIHFGFLCVQSVLLKVKCSVSVLLLVLEHVTSSPP